MATRLLCSPDPKFVAKYLLLPCCIVLMGQEVKLKVVTAGDHCFVRMLSKEGGKWLTHSV
jgi:hypothetical protein